MCRATWGPGPNTLERLANLSNATCICSSTMWPALMASSSSTNHLNKEFFHTPFYLGMSIFSFSGRCVCADPVAAACCYLNSLNCWAVCSINSSVLWGPCWRRKSTIYRPVWIPFRMSLTIAACCPSGSRADSNAPTASSPIIEFDRLTASYSIFLKWEYLSCVEVRSLPLHHATCSRSLDGLQSTIRCNGAQIACTINVQDTYTENRVSSCLGTSSTRTCRGRFQWKVRVNVELYLV